MATHIQYSILTFGSPDSLYAANISCKLLPRKIFLAVGIFRELFLRNQLEVLKRQRLLNRSERAMAETQ